MRLDKIPKLCIYSFRPGLRVSPPEGFVPACERAGRERQFRCAASCTSRRSGSKSCGPARQHYLEAGGSSEESCPAGANAGNDCGHPVRHGSRPAGTGRTGQRTDGYNPRAIRGSREASPSTPREKSETPGVTARTLRRDAGYSSCFRSNSHPNIPPEAGECPASRAAFIEAAPER